MALDIPLQRQAPTHSEIGIESRDQRDLLPEKEDIMDSLASRPVGLPQKEWLIVADYGASCKSVGA